MTQLNPSELQAYLAQNSQVEHLFMEKALPYLNDKNLKRAPARRYNSAIIQRQADKLYDEFTAQIHGKITQQLHGHKDREDWLRFIDSNNLLEELEDSMSELSFGDEE